VEAIGGGPAFWRGKRVFVTGHTGFKGSWLSLWLRRLGAEVHGYATLPPTRPSLFTVAGVASCLADHTVADVRDAGALTRAMGAAAPEIVFHLAAQPLVRHSYDAPVETYAVNVLGTVNVLEAVRACQSVRAVVNVTTDKCYENNDVSQSFRETDPLGGHDPYSSSKACSELVTAAYRDSFLQTAGVALASARAGNVIGGGDWASDRLVPDFFRAIDADRVLLVRHPEATRPWQHVLEPLKGYLLLGERLISDGERFSESWNFGPTADDSKPVRWILERLAAHCPGARWTADDGPHRTEAHRLRLDSSKAATRLGWAPRWDIGTALDRTLEWHRYWHDGSDMNAVCLAQIDAYESATA
jgi:CDP-glucose 4,6-dehydratase